MLCNVVLNFQHLLCKFAQFTDREVDDKAEKTCTPVDCHTFFNIIFFTDKEVEYGCSYIGEILGFYKLKIDLRLYSSMNSHMQLKAV